MTRRKNLIIGGLGFVGRNLVDRLLANDELVNIIDLNIHNQTWHKEDIYVGNSNFSFEIFDCGNVVNLVSSIKEFAPDRVFHFAANSDLSGRGELSDDLSNTLVSTLALCEAIRLEVPMPLIIFSSSSAVYGEMTGPISARDENLAFLPVNAYGWMKRASELSLVGACKGKRTRLIIARFPNVVGPHLTHGLLFDLIRKRGIGERVIQILGDGSQKKPFIHIDELLEILLEKISSLESDEIIFNITPSDQITVKEIVSIFSEAIGGASSFLYQEQREGWPGDITEYGFNLQESKDDGTFTEVSSAQAITRAIKENLERVSLP